MSVDSTKLIDGFSFEIKTNGFSVLSDIEEKAGGKNAAPSPHDYLEVALASCTAMTVQLYAKRKNMPLEYSDVKVKITAEGQSNEILREIHFVGEGLTEEQKESLLKIAEKCPVHKILAAGAKITSRII